MLTFLIWLTTASVVIAVIRVFFPFGYIQLLLIGAEKIINASMYLRYLLQRRYDEDAVLETWQGPGHFDE